MAGLAATTDDMFAALRMKSLPGPAHMLGLVLEFFQISVSQHPLVVNVMLGADSTCITFLMALSTHPQGAEVGMGGRL